MRLYGAQLFGEAPKNLHIIHMRRFFPPYLFPYWAQECLGPTLPHPPPPNSYVCVGVWREGGETELVKALRSPRDSALKWFTAASARIHPKIIHTLLDAK